jgi:hypothetical protein
MTALLAQPASALEPVGLLTPAAVAFGDGYDRPVLAMPEFQRAGAVSATNFLGDPRPEEDDFPHEPPPEFNRSGGQSDGDEAKQWPDLSMPGPDMGDFPNSAYTLPKGKAQIEFSPATLLTRDAQNPAAYIAPYLLRYGVTDNVEFRIFGNGVTGVGGDHALTGFSPPALDLKVHLWNDRRELWIPAASLEVYLSSTWGTPAFTGRWEPSLNMNFDLPVTKKLNVEWTVGYSGISEAVNIKTGEIFIPRFHYLVPGVHREVNLNFNQLSVQWAFEYQVTDRFSCFIDGFHNGALLLNVGSGEMIGEGVFYQFTDRLLGFGSVNEGLSRNLPSVAGQVGFAYAL